MMLVTTNSVVFTSQQKLKVVPCPFRMLISAGYRHLPSKVYIIDE